jgi:hypothetical protein
MSYKEKKQSTSRAEANATIHKQCTQQNTTPALPGRKVKEVTSTRVVIPNVVLRLKSQPAANRRGH